MTAVMRAVSATGPKVLRIALVQEGRVSEERILNERTHVTAGSSEGNLFVISSSDVPAAFRLFELVRGEYHLNFFDGMTGRIALSTGTFELATLKGQARRAKHGAYRIRLTNDARGKVVIGGTAFLFQFVPRAPIHSKPQLPMAVLRRASTVDWNTTIIAAVSFLIHFLLLGSISSDWLDPVIDDELDVAGVIDSLKTLPPPPAVEDKPEPPDTNATPAKAPEKMHTDAAAPAATPKAPSGSLNEQQAAALRNQLDQLELRELTALQSSNGPATARVLAGSELATDTLDRVAARSVGIGDGTDALRLGSGGGIVRPGTGNDLRTIGSKDLASGTGGTGKGASVTGP